MSDLLMKTPPKAVVLLSGGVDSTTTLAIARSMNFDVYALSFRYGQRHMVELEAAERVARQNRVAQHRTIDIDLRQIGGSALTADIDVPNTDRWRSWRKAFPLPTFRPETRFFCPSPWRGPK